MKERAADEQKAESQKLKQVRGAVKYFTHFVRKGGGGTPLTDKIRKVVFDGFPNCVF